MTDTAMAMVTRKGQMTIPQPLREALDTEPGGYVVFGIKGIGGTRGER